MTSRRTGSSRYGNLLGAEIADRWPRRKKRKRCTGTIYGGTPATGWALYGPGASVEGAEKGSPTPPRVQAQFQGERGKNADIALTASAFFDAAAVMFR